MDYCNANAFIKTIESAIIIGYAVNPIINSNMFESKTRFSYS